MMLGYLNEEESRLAQSLSQTLLVQKVVTEKIVFLALVEGEVIAAEAV